MTSTDPFLRRVRGRLALVGALEDLQRGAAGAVVLAAGLLGAEALGWIPASPTSLLLWSGAAALLAPLAGLLLRRPGPRRLAALADEHLGLRERVSTALWCESASADGGGPLGPLVSGDARAVVARVSAADLRRGFRPRPLRRPLGVLLAGAALCAGLMLYEPDAEADEPPEVQARRLAMESRVAEVARKVREAAKRVEATAAQKEAAKLLDAAKVVRNEAQRLARDPPEQKAALRRLTDLQETIRKAARERAGMREAEDPEDARRLDQNLEDMLQTLAEADLGDLQKDLKELEERLNADEERGLTPEQMRDLARRLDTVRRAFDNGDGLSSDMEKLLSQALGNSDLLEKISQRLREIASKLEQEGYEGMQGSGEGLDLSKLSAEDLQQLLERLDELANMEDLAEMLRQAAREMAGGRKIQFNKGDGT